MPERFRIFLKSGRGRVHVLIHSLVVDEGPDGSATPVDLFANGREIVRGLIDILHRFLG